MTYDIEHADILTWAAAYDGPLFHALLCDPPYHLTSITDRFGSKDAAPAQFGTDGAFQRASKGFMNATWDGGDIAFRPETWAALGRLLHPGAFCMAFASTRGFHRMAVAIEDAGFIIHPTIFCWGFASGFPKASRIDTVVDRRAGVERATVGTRKQAGAKFKLTQELIDNGGFNDPDRDDYDVTAPATQLAADWAGHRYGGQVLKPALEPIVVFQKPYQGDTVDCITCTGAGAINVDGGRINPGDKTPGGGRSWGAGANTHEGWKRPGNQNYEPSEPRTDGRWPSNLILSHSPECNGSCVEACPVRRLGEQSGELQSGSKHGFYRRDSRGIYGDFPPQEQHIDGDSGTVARFYYNADYMAERLEAADPLVFVPKASTTEREAGLTDFPVMSAADLTGRAPGSAGLDGNRELGYDHNPLAKVTSDRRNTHPTIKPISLARHLATLLLPPDRYAPRRLLVPFAGAASEMIGAMLAGWEDVQGVELEAQHVEIARARLAFWKQMRYKLMNPGEPVKLKMNPRPSDDQLEMF